MRSRSICAFLILLWLTFNVPDVVAARVLLNEYNAVSRANRISDGDAYLGRIQGNGGNWFELLVIEDQTDMRGWSLNWSEDEAISGSNETARGSIVLSTDALWSNLRAGTIITFIETTDADGAGVNTSTDRTYAPEGDDWWINVATRQEEGLGVAALTRTTTNDGAPGDFTVGNNDWTLTIRDVTGGIAFGPAGEGIDAWTTQVSNAEAAGLRGPGTISEPTPTWDAWRSITPESNLYGDIKSSSFGAPNVEFDHGRYIRLQHLGALRGEGFPPGTGDFDHDQLLTVNDIDILAAAIRAGATDSQYDLNQDGRVDEGDYATWVIDVRVIWFGDANFSGAFDNSDFIMVFQTGEYEDGIPLNSSWAEGDWNGDGEFGTGTLSPRSPMEVMNRDQGPRLTQHRSRVVGCY